VGPTFGAAMIMASRGENLGMVALTMFLFERADGTDHQRPQDAVGAALVAAGLLTLSGIDRTIEIGLERAAPDWLIGLAINL
jgi:cytochrome c-type biogenesis protein